MERTRLETILTPAKSGPRITYRGWYVTHFHRVNDADKPRLAKAFAFLKEKRADIWVGTFREVAQYGQERDTARLTVESSTPAALRLNLTDDMNDEAFDFPLALKVRLRDDWQDVQATQANLPVELQTLTHEGVRYALIQAVPDRGPIVLTLAKAK